LMAELICLIEFITIPACVAVWTIGRLTESRSPAEWMRLSKIAWAFPVNGRWLRYLMVFLLVLACLVMLLPLAFVVTLLVMWPD
jgi:hypothetical protein